MTDAYIFDHVRSPRGKGKKDGSLHEVTPVKLYAQMLGALKDRNGFDPEIISDVVTGCVTGVGEQGGDIGRFSAIMAGYGNGVPGLHVNRFCASALVAVNYAAARVMAGQADMMIGGGVESMSRVQMGFDGGAWIFDPQVSNEVGFVLQGISADLIATKYGFSREECDAYAILSQKRAKTAWDQGHFAKSVIPVKDKLGLTLLDHDEYMRPDTTLEDLAKLKASFTDMGQLGFDSVALQKYPEIEKMSHVHHAGNSSGIVDGASGMLIGTKEMGEKLGLKPRARMIGFADIGIDPTIMLSGPAQSARTALDRAGMAVSDVDVWEINEAFASVVLRFCQELDLGTEQVNVNGGAIAMGHPLGATGAMILGTALDEMERADKSTGLASLCVAGGMATATIIERV
ncbi:acetyl-CoA C-acetyltransferase [Paremcibacter congregatus]|uniref:Acetyl-CoA acetyltransferase n=1 Tax=Paremcibacter congregatus TaxID=2043170 RepID=A0A2G4YSC9_9PROT|nr:acetyl-CoA C-acetyltransferase [Paremcibacter congregatus]PHZ84356.1 acetyl-CoA acetyltransferase [Paremcibacter congregatus]QDE28576.1 acetyl-CoA C-acetyltransferase [Paremcibacter congregatus]